MFALLKAIVVGLFLAWLVSLFIGSGGSAGGMLYVRHVAVWGYEFYWSWPLFVIGTGLAFGIFLLMDN
jgi:hypothetical protein